MSLVVLLFYPVAMIVYLLILQDSHNQKLFDRSIKLFLSTAVVAVVMKMFFGWMEAIPYKNPHFFNVFFYYLFCSQTGIGVALLLFVVLFFFHKKRGYELSGVRDILTLLFPVLLSVWSVFSFSEYLGMQIPNNILQFSTMVFVGVFFIIAISRIFLTLMKNIRDKKTVVISILLIVALAVTAAILRFFHFYNSNLQYLSVCPIIIYFLVWWLKREQLLFFKKKD